MTYITEAFDLPPLALATAALALFTLGVLLVGVVAGASIVTGAAIVREIVTYWIFDNEDRS